MPDAAPAFSSTPSEPDGVLHVEHRDGGAVLHLRIDRPRRKNALTVEMYAALADAFEAAETDDAVRAIVVTASGDAFTAGNDLADFLDRPPTGEDSAVFRFLGALARGTRPVVAAVHGAAVGIGTTMLLHCDVVVATPDARLMVPFVALGLVPEAGASLLLPLRIGPARAAEMLMLGAPMSGEDAHHTGLVTRLATRDDVDDAAFEAAAALAAQPAAALRATRALLRAPYAEALDAALRREGHAFLAALASDETRAILSRRLRR